MDADVYFAEYLIRERLAEARARAEFAALLGEPSRGSPRAPGFAYGLFELGRSLLKRRGRRVAGTRRPLEGGRSMTYTAKPLSCDPTKLRGLSGARRLP
jgi:hypothetical protein